MLAPRSDQTEKILSGTSVMTRIVAIITPASLLPTLVRTHHGCRRIVKHPADVAHLLHSGQVRPPEPHVAQQRRAPHAPPVRLHEERPRGSSGQAPMAKTCGTYFTLSMKEHNTHTYVGNR